MQDTMRDKETTKQEQKARECISSGLENRAVEVLYGSRREASSNSRRHGFSCGARMGSDRTQPRTQVLARVSGRHMFQVLFNSHYPLFLQYRLYTPAREKI